MNTQGKSGLLNEASIKLNLKENHPIKKVKSKNPQHKADTLNKELNNVEYLLKVEEKKKKTIQQQFEKEMAQIDLQKEKLEDELDLTLKEINEKEAQIFKIQKNNFDEFKEEIEKYQVILEELKVKGVELEIDITKARNNQIQLLNISNLLKEEYDSYQNELLLLRRNVDEKVKSLKELGSSYPKEFKALQEDFQLANELSDFKQKNIIINGQLKQSNKENQNKISELKDVKAQKESLKEEYDIIDKEITVTANDQSLTKLKEHIIKNIRDIYLWDTLISVMKEFFSEKIFDVDHKFHERLYQQLVLNLSSISKDFSGSISKKEKERNTIIKRLNEIKPSTNEEKQNYLSDLTTLQKELENISNYINALQQKYSKIEELYNGFLSTVQLKGYSCSEDLEMQFKNEILRMIITENNFSMEEIGNFEHLIQTFYTEMGIKERSLKSLINKQNKTKNQMNQLDDQIEKLEEEIKGQNDIITRIKQEIAQNSNNIRLVSETIIIRNKNLKADLETLSDEKFREYVKQNEDDSKIIKKIYGNKFLNKVYSVHKKKFMEDVILDHSEKKTKVNDDISYISQYDKTLSIYKTGLNKIEVEYHCSLEYLNQSGYSIEVKKKEYKIIEDSIVELEDKIKVILEAQIKETEKEKESLKYKFNINFYLTKIKDINGKLDKLEKQKMKILSKLTNYEKEYGEKTHKLHFEDLDIKNNLIEVMMGVNEESISTAHPFRHHTENDPNNPYKFHSSNSINIDETVKKSLEEFNEIDSNFTPEGLRDQIQSNSPKQQLDYNKFLLKPEVNVLKEKLKPLYNGLTIYKRFSSSSGFSQYNDFDPKKDKIPPENCGYAMRTFKLNNKNMSIEVFQSDLKRSEMRILFKDLNKIILNPSSKEIIKSKEKISTNLSQQLVLLSKNDYIQFTLVLKSSTIDLLSSNYLAFTSFQTAVNEIIKMKSSIEENIRKISFEDKAEE